MTDLEKLRGFANDVMRDWWLGGMDGAELQELAVKWELLEPLEVTKPCGDGCNCADAGCDFPVTCYRKTPLIGLCGFGEPGLGSRSIPARRDVDPDLIISDALKAQESAIRDRERERDDKEYARKEWAETAHRVIMERDELQRKLDELERT